MSTKDWLDKLGQLKDSVKNQSESKKYTEGIAHDIKNGFIFIIR